MHRPETERDDDTDGDRTKERDKAQCRRSNDEKLACAVKECDNRCKANEKRQLFFHRYASRLNRSSRLSAVSSI